MKLLILLFLTFAISCTSSRQVGAPATHENRVIASSSYKYGCKPTTEFAMICMRQDIEKARVGEDAGVRVCMPPDGSADPIEMVLTKKTAYGIKLDGNFQPITFKEGPSGQKQLSIIVSDEQQGKKHIQTLRTYSMGETSHSLGLCNKSEEKIGNGVAESEICPTWQPLKCGRLEFNGVPYSGILKCESENKKEKLCITMREIKNAKISKQISKSPCTLGVSYSVSPTAIKVWNGCGAEFSVESQ